MLQLNNLFLDSDNELTPSSASQEENLTSNNPIPKFYWRSVSLDSKLKLDYNRINQEKISIQRPTGFACTVCKEKISKPDLSTLKETMSADEAIE